VFKQRINMWLRMNRSKKATVQDESMPDANDEYLIYQTIIGACPLVMKGDDETASFRARIQAYMLKAAREAKRFTSWVNQNDEYESAMNNFIERILTPSSTNPFIDDLSQFQSVIAPLGLANSLVQTVLKLTCPGVPDIYQGTELWDFSLVDPDNRRPVDYSLRRSLLDSMESHIKLVEQLPASGGGEGRRQFAGKCLDSLTDGKLKLYLSACLLRFRHQNNKLFSSGKYLPLEVTGREAEHVVAFARQQEGRWAVVVVPHLIATLLKLDDPDRFKGFDVGAALKDAKTWGDTAVILPEQIQAKEVTNLFTSDKLIATNGQLLLSDVFATLPVCVLVA
jgi:(1->4)-alpha-D-glucan 1-alpha-D-glucosylmutase